jgi:UDP-glucose 4-epimerase
MARYLVTGGCGFIGSHLTERLLALGHEALVLDNLSTGKRDNLPAGVRLIEGDVADQPLVDAALAGTDGCFHLAAVASVQKSNEDWLGTHRANLTGTIAVLDGARRHGRLPVVYASSAAVYGDNPDLPLAETAQLRPLSAYGADKMGSELHARVASLVHGVPTTGFRFFNVFGPRQDPHSPYSGVISIFINRLLAGQPVTIFGDGLQSRDFIYVSDIVDHLVAAMTKPEAEARVFNACTGRATTLLDLVGVLGTLIGITPDIHFAAPRAGDIRFSLGNPALAVARLGVSARTSLSNGLAATLPSAPKAP